MSEIKPWKCLSREVVAKARVFDMVVQRMQKPGSDYQDDYYFIECPDWNNVIAITDDEQVVLIEQYRHGVQEVCLEIPGGIIDPGEDPEQGAIRELAEETGYVPKKVESLGFVHPNPALQSNKCHLFLATGAELKAETNFDDDEDISVRLASLEEVLLLIDEGKISHSMMVAAFFKFFILREGSFQDSSQKEG